VAVPGHLDGGSPPSRAPRRAPGGTDSSSSTTEHQRPLSWAGTASGRRKRPGVGAVRSASSSTCAGTARARAVRTHQAASSDGAGTEARSGSRVVEATTGGGGRSLRRRLERRASGHPREGDDLVGLRAVGGSVSPRPVPASAALGPASGVPSPTNVEKRGENGSRSARNTEVILR